MVSILALNLIMVLYMWFKHIATMKEYKRMVDLYSHGIKQAIENINHFLSSPVSQSESFVNYLFRGY